MERQPERFTTRLKRFFAPERPTMRMIDIGTVAAENARRTQEATQRAAEIALQTLPENIAQQTIGRFKEDFHTERRFPSIGVDWTTIERALGDNPQKLWSIAQMYNNAHRPRALRLDRDGICIATSSPYPIGPRSIAFDPPAHQKWRLENPVSRTPGTTAIAEAKAIGLTLMSPKTYLDHLRPYDQFIETARGEDYECWLATDEATREQGYANCGDTHDGKAIVRQPLAHEALMNRGWRGELWLPL